MLCLSGFELYSRWVPLRKDLDGGSLDIHKAIGKLPRPAGGWTLPGHKYTGP